MRSHCGPTSLPCPLAQHVSLNGKSLTGKDSRVDWLNSVLWQPQTVCFLFLEQGGPPTGIETTACLKGASVEPTESQTQPDKLHGRLENCAEVEGDKKKEAVAVLEAMVELAVVPAQSALTHEMDDDGDDDMTPAGHVALSHLCTWAPTINYEAEPSQTVTILFSSLPSCGFSPGTDVFSDHLTLQSLLSHSGHLHFALS